ncbi:MAG: UDP-N-acetylmuramoyl-L-alanyl-D-glutamate--2,6-diaminopimelate ligase [Bacteroidales bacterium]|nr:UDP-N-acetylmuramoyl-L-alanyl-D-glutamate--2,6-diaminopimelate ligase [Bacteroidales bacterium]
MKDLQDILRNVEIEMIIGGSKKHIADICFDSRKVQSNSLFVAQKGTEVDGHKFIEQSIAKGASVVVCEDLPQSLNPSVTYIKVVNSDIALGIMASNYFDNPSEKLKLIGITGTNGKTTTVTLLHNLFLSFGYKVGCLSTIVNKINEREVPSTHTTPDAIELNNLLAQMVDEGCLFVFMEVSSHSIVQNRIAGLQFFGGIFSNITHDHLDYHKTFDAYIDAKKAFFDMLPPTAFSLVNTDDKHGLVMQQNTAARRFTYALAKAADFHATIIENTFDGLLLNIDNVEVSTRLVGKFNAQNLLAIYATAVLCGIDKEKILIAMSLLESANGRFNTYTLKSGAKAIVDYAHTPDALANVLSTIRDIVHKSVRVITVVGCGGNRDKTKRPEMANIAQRESDILILTSDNPRDESPEAIIDDMIAGLSTQDNVLTIADRRSAIKTACTMANKGDIVLVAGKGHETYQEINRVKLHFDDAEEIARFC